MKAALLAAALLIPAGAAGGEPLAPGKAAAQAGGAADGISSDQAKFLSTFTPAGCVKDARCWGLVKTVFQKTFGLNREKVDTALPGQFFPNTTTFALRAAIKGSGHYLYILCGSDLNKRHRPCNDQRRDELEQRVFESAVVYSVPSDYKQADLADPETMKLTPAGKKLLLEINQARPGAVQELLGLAINSLGVEDNPVPKALR